MAQDSLGQNQLHTNEQTTGFYHNPVMLAECLEALNIKADGTYSDCTLGGAGHSYAIALRLDERGTLHAFDRDEDAIAFAKRRQRPSATRCLSFWMYSPIWSR